MVKAGARIRKEFNDVELDKSLFTIVFFLCYISKGNLIQPLCIKHTLIDTIPIHEVRDMCDSAVAYNTLFVVGYHVMQALLRAR